MIIVKAISLLKLGFLCGWKEIYNIDQPVNLDLGFINMPIKINKLVLLGDVSQATT